MYQPDEQQQVRQCSFRLVSVRGQRAIIELQVVKQTVQICSETSGDWLSRKRARTAVVLNEFARVLFRIGIRAVVVIVVISVARQRRPVKQHLLRCRWLLLRLLLGERSLFARSGLLVIKKAERMRERSRHRRASESLCANAVSVFWRSRRVDHSRRTKPADRCEHNQAGCHCKQRAVGPIAPLLLLPLALRSPHLLDCDVLSTACHLSEYDLASSRPTTAEMMQ